MVSFWKVKGNFVSLSYDPGDRAKDLLQSGSCSCCVQLAKGSNAMLCGSRKAEHKGRILRHLLGTVSISRTRQSPAVQLGEEGTGAKQRGGAGGKRNPHPKLLKGVTPQSP